MNTQHIAIIADSGTDPGISFIQAHDIRIIPLRINYTDGSSYRSMVDISSAEVIQSFEKEIPTTSLPSPDAIQKTLEQARADGYQKAIIVTISSGLSSTNQTVGLIARDYADFPVTVLDTKNIGLGAGLIVRAAALLAEKGIAYEDIIQKCTQLIENTRLWFSTKTLSYLRKGGRISEATYRLGSILNIKPVITCTPKGKYAPVKKARGFQKALQEEVNFVARYAQKFSSVIVGICSSNSQECARELERAIRERLTNIAQVIHTQAPPELLVHTGPDLVGMCVQPNIFE